MFTKCLAVIKSCETWDQRRIAKKYIDLAYLSRKINTEEFFYLFELIMED